MRKIRQYCFLERNRIFIALTILLLPMLFWTVKYSDAPLLVSEKWFGFLLCDPNADKTLYNLAIGYISAYVFYIIQVYIPTRTREKRAWILIHKPLSMLVRDLKELLYVTSQMIDAQENGISKLKSTSCYYKKEHLDSYFSILDRNPQCMMSDGRYVRKTPCACRSISDFIRMSTEIGKRAQKLMDMPALSNLDIHTNELIIEIDACKFCEELANTTNVIAKSESLGREFAIAQNKHQIEQIQMVLKDYPEYHVIEESNQYYVVGPNNYKKFILSNEYEEFPLSTSLITGLKKLEVDIERLEYFNDLDGDITFEKMVEEEIKRLNENGKIIKPVVQKVFGKQ